MTASATGTCSPPRVSAPKRKKLPLDPTIEAKRKCNASSPAPWVPPKLRLETKLSQRRTPQEWSRQAGASTTSACRPSSSTVSAHTAGHVEVVGEDRAGRARRPREGLGVGEGPVALVGDHEVGAAAVAVERRSAAAHRRGRCAEAPRTPEDAGRRVEQNRRGLRRSSESGSRPRGRRRTTGWPSPGWARCRCGGSRPTRSLGRARPGRRTPASRGRRPRGGAPRRPRSRSGRGGHGCSGYGERTAPAARHLSQTFSVPSDAGMSGLQM